MLENMENTLFNPNVDALVIDFNNTRCNEDVVEVLIDTIMEESLTRVTQLLSAITSSNITSFKRLARKK
jgi:hypothetical protein